jgi:hypothetical protein
MLHNHLFCVFFFHSNRYQQYEQASVDPEDGELEQQSSEQAKPETA